ncbi:MAG TPA: TonB-dependent receptor plug domain-containing protein, partial [Opitutus sp.]|nr:TonB-dependent receptor plug domain-containing protein [Opitutus sp.]
MKHQTQLGVLVLAASAVCQGLIGQTTQPPSRTAAEPEDEVVQLSPFEIRAEQDTGYQATETLAGTRIRTDLKDVGAAITVLTREFIDDIGAVDNLTLLQYTPNVEVGGTRSTYAGTGSAQSVSENVTNPSANTRVRGLSAADNTRDFFVSDIPWDGYNVDRIDVQRGPNSILFGLGKPAGIVNASLRGADFRNRVQFQNRFGSYESLRNSLDINRVLLRDELAVRLIGLVDHENFRQESAFQDDERFYGTLRWDPKFLRRNGMHTTLRIKFEDGRISSNNPRTLTPNDNVSHFFRPVAVTASNPWGGLGKGVFDPYLAATGSTVGGDNQGQLSGTDPDYNPWINANSLVQQQQPVFLIDGSTGALHQAYGGLVPYAIRTPTGAIGGATNIPAGFPSNSAPFLAVSAPQDFARSYQLPNYQAGLYRQWGLQDPSIFDFYNVLIDGPNKWELKTWDAFNVDLAQTAFGDRAGVNLTYDRQAYRSANEAFIGGTPSLNVDLNARFQDLSENPNAGRAFVSGAGGGGWSTTEREVARASLFGELRATDFLREGFWSKLLGRHRFNGVYAREKFEIQNRGYLLNAAAQSWYERRYTPASAATASFDDRRPTAVVYLGPSLLDYDSAAGLHLPGIQAPIMMNDAPLNHFWTSWNAPSSVVFDAPWDRS